MDDGLGGVSVYETFPLSCPPLPVTGQTLMATTHGWGGILTIPKIAKYLKVTERTTYKLAGATKIPAFKFSGIWRLKKADVDAKQSIVRVPTRSRH
jgi:excisionase family DNA binding protein